MNSRTVAFDGLRASKPWILSFSALFAVLAIGSAFPPGDWYEALRTPTWQPPAWVFAPVWTLIYLCLAVAFALILSSRPRPARRDAIGWFIAQLVFNAAWTPLFFGLQSPMWAFFDVCLLWICALCSVIAAFNVRPAAAWLQVLHLLWVSFALVLNGVILALNP